MDKIIVEALWKESTQRVVSEWSDFVLYVFIVVPQYPIPPNTWIEPSPAQIASSISLVFSIGSIITGLLLIRRNRTMMTKDPNSVWHYLYGMKWPVVGLEPLAIAFSLTYALLMWSFQDTSSKIWIAVGIAAGIVIITVVWEHTTDQPYEPELKVWNGTQA
ncbi:hypothetical protein EDB92DRAFT_1847230 [Lactarius akahatsu]|uniref:Uncharacterized protein n=1 Tax=Lactarius akahatsu TaxID=416441 RepID=A0AAD4LK43_9AGAM|nr:hypothetical protein EDB92DRAFT_1847230 [Lactarius akahatsu]